MPDFFPIAAPQPDEDTSLVAPAAAPPLVVTPEEAAPVVVPSIMATLEGPEAEVVSAAHNLVLAANVPDTPERRASYVQALAAMVEAVYAWGAWEEEEPDPFEEEPAVDTPVATLAPEPTSDPEPVAPASAWLVPIRGTERRVSVQYVDGQGWCAAWTDPATDSPVPMTDYRLRGHASEEAALIPTRNFAEMWGWEVTQ